ncbi:MAG: YfhO family protein [Myxococcota bacterium]|nr:YfhO family protein [Myxococcota bacterium]
MAAAVWVHRIEIDAPTVHRTLVQSDVYRYYHPVAGFVHRELSAGRLPLWNPYQLAGQPFLGLPVTGVLYPPNILIMGLFEANTALGVQAVLHFFLAGLFTWLLAARLGLNPAARTAAALAYMISGPMVLGLYVSVQFSTQAWLPAILWALHGLFSEARLKWALALAAVAALTFHGGFPQLFIYIVQFTALFGLVFFFKLTASEQRMRVLALGAFAGLLALGWALPALLPQLEFTREASRSLDGLTLQQASYPFLLQSTLWESITRSVAEAVSGHPSGPVDGRVALPFLFLPLLLAGLLARGSRGYWLFFLVMATLTGLLMLGLQTPLFEAYYSLPFTALFRGPIRIAFLWTFCAALLMGIGVQGITQFVGLKSKGDSWAGAIGVVLVILLASDAYMRTQLISAHPSSHDDTKGAPAELIEFMRARPGRERIYFETHTLYSPGFLLKSGSINGFFVAADYEPSVSRDYLDYFEYSGSTPWHGVSTILDGDRPHAARIEPRMLDLMGVRFYGVHQPGRRNPLPEMDRLLGPPFARLGTVNIYERKSALPRAYTVGQVQIAADQATAMLALRSPGFAPRISAVVSRNAETLPDSLSGAAPGSGGGFIAQESKILEALPERMTIRASCSRDCLAVLSDLDYPGWRAEVDGEPTPIVRVNGLFRGVPLRAGEHTIAYRFEPGSFHLGLLAALIATGLGAASLLARRRGLLA